MIRTVALLALIASASAIWPWDSEKLWNSGFHRTFNAFVELPKVIEDGWVEVEKPATSTGYDDLLLYVKLSEPTTGIYIDRNSNYTAGVMTAVPVNATTPYYDTTEQGLKLWNCSINGVINTFYTSSIFFVSEDTLTRTYDKNEVIQADKVTFVSINGILDTLPKNLTVIQSDETSAWKEQSCVIWMGLHYYQYMTNSTTCDEPFTPYFGLFDNKTKQLIGVGYMTLGECVGDTFEHPSQAAVKMIVENGPQCLYELVKKYGVCTRHYYFVDHPRLITC